MIHFNLEGYNMSDAAFWDKAAAKYAKDAISDMTAYEATRDRIRQLLKPHHRILEIGCGTGSTALELADKVASYVGTDLSPKMIVIAQSKQSNDTPAHLSFEVHDAAELPSGPHDVILALNLLHLVPNLEDVLAQIHDALPSGGLLIAKTGLLQDGAWYLRWMIPVMRAIGKAPYVCSLSEVELLGLLNKTGFATNETLVQDGMVPRMFTVSSKP
ncbi:MAG: putative TPR repeat methyltransferase [Ascidiaceihabitans sp.]|jgi:predicted TPR repeat methyltransferase|tara:strand:+ start:14914 stop:15558 length:645 start_codon:yes stop_codon:yes gene_type:complete